MKEVFLPTHNNFNHEVIIVGAGIAGIAASKKLKKNNISHIILEANDRLGGRAKKANEKFGSWFDLGCSYLHEGKINPLVQLSESFGTAVKKENGDIFTIEKTNFLLNGFPFSEPARISILNSDKDFKTKLSMAEKHPIDNHLSSCLDMKDPNYPILSNLLSGLNAVEPALVSIKDFASAKEGQDFIIETGLANLVENWGFDLNVKFNCPVNQVSWSGNKISVQTKDSLFQSRKILLTVSNGILNENSIKFFPELPSYKIKAIRSLPMGILNKVGILFRDGTFKKKDEGWYVICKGKDENKISSVMSFEIRTQPENHIIVFFGGMEGKELESLPEKTFLKIRRALSQTFGDDIQERITKFINSSWASDKCSLGSYSYALPGKSIEREQLRRPLMNKLFFAGEATNKKHYGTCHGAYLSGEKAAEEIISCLRS